ncbi:magnesium-translocating P-type ATPase [Streptococcus equinus]|uniref:magnesium-translocating P-type ATPase n=1 Tax=Streptococcus equinus TaxID=1335 RepID=UPI0008864E71|nr:magnesium-translocating P-type ATPase [Streptococcus equinus]SDI35060.1 Mg2+-importing ATPase [Streptococcus equinus]SEP56863.1 Mg2+-importing ATPase [Streptococcus equinus]
MKKNQKEQAIIALAKLSNEELIQKLDTTPVGLDNEIAQIRLRAYGKNKINAEKPKSVFQIIAKSFLDPFVLVLFLLMIVSFVTKDIESAVVMALMIIVSVSISFVQEFKAQKSSQALKEMIENTTSVIRDGQVVEIPMDEVVPGDIINIATGDMIPADAILIQSRDLYINQSSLTGESVPVAKNIDYQDHSEQAIFDQPNLIFMGSDVISGNAKAVIVHTGQETLFGDIAKKSTVSRGETTFSKGLVGVSRVLIRLIAILFPIVFLLNGFLKQDWSSAFFFAIAVVVGLTPEMLPMIVTSNLAKGANRLAKEKVIVKEMSAIQNLGAMDVLCTDKTGTITEDRVVLVEHVDVNGERDNKVLEYAFLNSYYQTGWRNLMDEAVISYFKANPTNPSVFEHKTIDEIPFDFSRRRMSLIIDEGESHLMITKGAIEEVIQVSTHILENKQQKVLDSKSKENLLELSQSLNTKGMRVLAVAIKNANSDINEYSPKDECQMTIVGLVGFLDPAKESAKGAIKNLHEHGVAVKVLTGDNAIVAAKVCEDVGISAEKHLLGKQIEEMTDQELAEACEEYQLFAKCTPLQKSRIIQVLKQKGHTVGFMGDGINDAPALRMADVGISVDTAADITKDASSIILLEKSLMVLVTGVLEGRAVFENMMKYIKLTLSSNFGNVFSILVASAFLPFLPMVSMQLLLQNVIYDIAQLAMPWDNVDEEAIQKPVRWDLKELWNFTWRIGPISSIFDILTFLVLWFVVGANTMQTQSIFQAGWFAVGLVTQIAVVHVVRTNKRPFMESRASFPVTLFSVMGIFIGFLVLLSPIHTFVDFGSLPLKFWPWYIILVLGYLITVQLVRKYLMPNKKDIKSSK